MSTTGSSSDESVHDCDAPVPDSDAEGEDAPADSLVPATPVFSQHTHMPGHHVLIGSTVCQGLSPGVDLPVDPFYEPVQWHGEWHPNQLRQMFQEWFPDKRLSLSDFLASDRLNLLSGNHS